MKIAGRSLLILVCMHCIVYYFTLDLNIFWVWIWFESKSSCWYHSSIGVGDTSKLKLHFIDNFILRLSFKILQAEVLLEAKYFKILQTEVLLEAKYFKILQAEVLLEAKYFKFDWWNEGKRRGQDNLYCNLNKIKPANEDDIFKHVRTF